MPPAAFDGIADELDYPMYIVTAATRHDRAGCLVGFATQCGIDPLRFAIWISKKNYTFRVASAADVVVVHVIRHGDEELAALFGSETGDDIDKFRRCQWRPGPGGAPVLKQCDWFAGTVLERFDTGDHMGMLLEPFEGESKRSGVEPLGFQNVRRLRPGHPA
jgi:flavin reductase (DIM6/NTAB) family NADH-FMN oxidoreductase RutF